MRWVSLVLVVLLAGCSQAAEPEPQVDEVPRRSVGGDSPDEGPKFDVARLFSTAVVMAAVDEQSFDVVVPNGTTELYFIHEPEIEGSIIVRSLWVEVDTCGRWEATGPWGGNVQQQEDICRGAVPGAARFVVGTDGGFVHGDFELWGRTPRLDNATVNG